MKVKFKTGRYIPGIGTFNPGDVDAVPDRLASQLIQAGVAEQATESGSGKLKKQDPSERWQDVPQTDGSLAAESTED